MNMKLGIQSKILVHVLSSKLILANLIFKQNYVSHKSITQLSFYRFKKKCSITMHIGIIKLNLHHN